MLLVLSDSCKSSLQEVIILVLDVSTNDFATIMFRAHTHTTWQRTKLPQNPRTTKNQTHDETRQCEQICKITSSLDVGVIHADFKMFLNTMFISMTEAIQDMIKKISRELKLCVS